MLNVPSIGQTVIVRSRPYTVESVEAQSEPPSFTDKPDAWFKPQHLVTMRCLDETSLDEELSVIWELEPGTEIRDKSSFPTKLIFDDPSQMEAFIHAVRWGIISQMDINTLQSPFRSGIELQNYQLEPVAKALLMPRVNMLLADDVGLGKTIEAGLVMEELMLRSRINTVLIVCPASLQIQWQEEMRDKFGLEFRIINAGSVSKLRRKRGIHVNPWTHFPRLITSIDYLKQEHILRRFVETLPDASKTWPRTFDLLILDEAHCIAPAGTLRYIVSSQRTKTIQLLAAHFEHRLFLTATPHNGYTDSFSTLLELLDNQRFIRGVPPSKQQLS